LEELNIMKKKQMSKKLLLNKSTLANLNEKAMELVNGGGLYTDATCRPMCDTISCNTECFVPETLCICTCDMTNCVSCNI